MTEASRQQAKKPVSALLAGPYGHPFHPMLVSVPIGAWTASLVFDVASRVADDHDFLARGATWLIALGIVGALAAGSAGFLDLMAVPAGTRAFRTGVTHMALNLAVTAAYAGGFLWRQADAGTGGVGTGPLALNAVCLVTLAVSGWLGGRLSFRYGVRVADEQVQAEGFAPLRPRPAEVPPSPR